MRALVVSVSLATVLGAPAAARAEPTDVVSRPLVLDAGELDVRLSAEGNLLPRRLGQPLSLAPDAWYGVTSRWTIGLTHSSRSVDRIDAVASFCVRELEGQCDRAYQGSGLDVVWSWRRGALAIAPRGRLLLRGVEPWKPAVTVGARVRYARGRLGVEAEPYLRVGLASRDRGNRDALVVPVRVLVQPTCRWALGVRTGWDSELAVIADGWHVPVALVVRVRAPAHLDVGLEAGYRSLLGPQNNYGQSAALLTVGWRGVVAE